MYEKFQTQKEYLISNKIYYENKWFLEKEIISTWCFHPVFKKMVNFKIHLGKLFPENFEIIDKVYKDGRIIEEKEIISLENRLNERHLGSEIVEMDFNNELKKYIPNPTDGNDLYCYVECFRKGKKLPDYYNLVLFEEDYEFEDCSINSKNSYALCYFYPIDGKFAEATFERLINSCFVMQALSMLENINKIFNNYYSSQDISIIQINYFLKELDNIKNDIGFLYAFILDVLNSFIDELCISGKAMRCLHCGNVISFLPNKKYCSLSVDGQDCKIKAKNQRQYRKRKLKGL